MFSKFRRLIVIISIVCLFASCSTTKEKETYNPHTEEQIAALDNWNMTTLIAKGDSEKSRPEPFVIHDVYNSEKVVLTAKNGEEREVKVVDGKAEVYNLLLGEDYSWIAIDENGETIEEGSFSVSSNPPRNLYVDGITNIRDLGGWKRDDGTRVKQGLIYRSARLSENYSGEVILTNEGRDTLLSLGIKSEIDLRKTDENGEIIESPIGKDVNYISIPFATGGGYLQKNLSFFPFLFKELGDAENYPLIFHCSIGTDRTGAVSFVLLSLLSVSEDDIYRDYLFSNFGDIEGIRRKTAIDDYLLFTERFEGENLKEKVTSMLINNGVEESDINNFISIMTESSYLL